jgi:hypothetical protein
LYISARSAGQETEDGQAKRRVAKLSTVIATFSDFMFDLYSYHEFREGEVTAGPTAAIPKVMYYQLRR